MNRKIIAGLMLVSVALLPACSKRQIDTQITGSFPIEGTSWQGFCRGTTAFIWVPGYSGEDDEIEAVHYNDPACPGTVEGPVQESDPDGVLEDED